MNESGSHGPVLRAADVADYLRQRLGLAAPPLRTELRRVIELLEPDPAQVGRFVGGVLRGYLGPPT